MVNQPAFPAQQDMDALYTIANADFGYLPYPLRDGAVVAPALIMVDRAALHHQAITTPLLDTVIQKLRYRLLLPSRPQAMKFYHTHITEFFLPVNGPAVNGEEQSLQD